MQAEEKWLVPLIATGVLGLAGAGHAGWISTTAGLWLCVLGLFVLVANVYRLRTKNKGSIRTLRTRVKETEKELKLVQRQQRIQADLIRGLQAAPGSGDTKSEAPAEGAPASQTLQTTRNPSDQERVLVWRCHCARTHGALCVDAESVPAPAGTRVLERTRDRKWF